MQNKSFRHKKNLLLPLVIFGLVIAGMISVMLLSGKRQDNRQQAAVDNGLIKISFEPVANCVVGSKCSAKLFLDTGEANIDGIQLKLLFNKDQVSWLAFYAKKISPLSLIKKTVADGTDKELTLVWTLVNPNSAYKTKNTKVLLGTILFIAKDNMTDKEVTFNMDQVFSKATLYQTGQDSLNKTGTVQTMIAAKGCKSDDNCKDTEFCFQPPTVDPAEDCEGEECEPLIPGKICKAKIASCEYQYSDWSDCKNGSQTRKVLNGNQIICSTPPVLKQFCTPTCTQECPGSDNVLKDCVTPAANGTARQVACNQSRKTDKCGGVDYCCPKAGAAWTKDLSICTAPPAYLRSDFNADGKVNSKDLSIMLKKLFTTEAVYDLNKDSKVDIADYSLFIRDFVEAQSE